jgi:hypothetical protein
MNMKFTNIINIMLYYIMRYLIIKKNFYLLLTTKNILSLYIKLYIF